ncbi:uncharacterized protein LAESUDRAFT_764525 [Laetiporus sulphureus 93-53]|uniref:Uncharacterized protein n=1 Tax=Laetiporus sulphureus 93-53 TaxID=1314785 RepID=A0A165B960_9APHY|nr:uncharacterized protein LAESUDRAFT_764525 [Laetiporus sulphureus 93-53]KZT00532.1 hypothetical protein LAESUDRAFT_764525 [Laetiporus sulphureus 93-53]
MVKPTTGSHSCSASASNAGGPGPAPLLQPMPVPVMRSSRKITITTFLLTFFSSSKQLDRVKGNYATWSREIVDSLRMAQGLDRYLTGAVVQPDPNLDFDSSENWIINDRMICAYISKSCSTEEQHFISSGSYDTVKDLWDAIRSHHQQQGTYTQALLLQEALSCHFNCSEHLLVTVERIQDLVECIYAIGLPTADSLTCICLLHAMGGDFAHVQSQVGTALADSHRTKPYTAADIIACVDLEQRLIDGTSGASKDVLLTKRAGHFSSSKKTCTNSWCPRPQGHDTANCWGPGGVMEGCRDEVLSHKKVTWEKGKSSGSSSLIKKDGSGHVYLIDDAGQTYFLSAASASPITASSAASPSPSASEFASLAAVSPDWLTFVSSDPGRFDESCLRADISTVTLFGSPSDDEHDNQAAGDKEQGH